MKKTLFETGIECHYLYYGVSGVYGDFVLETGGEPTCLNELEDAGADELIEAINNVISNPNTYWEPCEEEDEEYISDTLEAWGIK